MIKYPVPPKTLKIFGISQPFCQQISVGTWRSPTVPRVDWLQCPLIKTLILKYIGNLAHLMTSRGLVFIVVPFPMEPFKAAMPTIIGHHLKYNSCICFSRLSSECGQLGKRQTCWLKLLSFFWLDLFCLDLTFLKYRGFIETLQGLLKYICKLFVVWLTVMCLLSVATCLDI